MRGSSESSGRVRPRNMKSMRPPLVAIFFMTNFYRAGGMAPSPPPPDPLLRGKIEDRKTLKFLEFSNIPIWSLSYSNFFQ